MIEPQNDPPQASVRPLTPEEERWDEWFATQELHSPDNLEAVARQLLGLITGLLGLLLAVLALSESPLPTYLSHPVVPWLGGLGIILLLVALLFAMGVLWPSRLVVSPHKLQEEKAAFRAMVGRKGQLLRIALGAFVWGVLLLGALLVLALFSAAGSA